MEKLTIGLPVYNGSRYLKMALLSILGQSFKDFKLLVVDDGSTDNSEEIIKEFNDPRIVYLKDGKNLGLPARLNQIIALADTQYIARMDADDIMHFKRIEKQIKCLDSNSDIDVLGTNCYTIDENNKIKGIRSKLISDQIIEVNSFVHPTIIGKTEWFKKNQYDLNLKRAQDTELWLRTRSFSKFCKINEPLLFYREIGGGYYRKYFKALKSKRFIIASLVKKKKIWEAIKFFLKDYTRTFFVGIIYAVFSLIKLEGVLLANRNGNLVGNSLSVANEDFERSISGSTNRL